jgi:hypothetical protein
MSKKHFITLADAIKHSQVPFSADHLEVLADFCRSQNSQFNGGRWMDYIAGNCGPNGGKI